MKVKTKYSISVSILFIAVGMNLLDIKIQDNLVEIIKFVLGGILFGYGFKKLSERFSK